MHLGPIAESRHDTYCLSQSGLLLTRDAGKWVGDKGYVDKQYDEVTTDNAGSGAPTARWWPSTQRPALQQRHSCRIVSRLAARSTPTINKSCRRWARGHRNRLGRRLHSRLHRNKGRAAQRPDHRSVARVAPALGRSAAHEEGPGHATAAVKGTLDSLEPVQRRIESRSFTQHSRNTVLKKRKNPFWKAGAFCSKSMGFRPALDYKTFLRFCVD
jgi:hypothetical protein